MKPHTAYLRGRKEHWPHPQDFGIMYSGDLYFLNFVVVGVIIIQALIITKALK